MPVSLKFTPEGSDAEFLELSVEEIESLRLCDLEGLEQDAAAVMMDVSRGTLQRILYSAHRKVAQALCEGMGIAIGGGDYEIAGQGCRGAASCSRCPFRSDTHTQGDVSK